MNSKTNWRKFKKAKRIKEAWKLRMQGFNLQEIADRLKVSIATICRDIQEAYDVWRQQEDEKLSKCAEIDLARTEYLMSRLIPGVEDGDVQSINAYRQLLHERALRLGHLAPQKVDLTANNSGETLAELERRLKEEIGKGTTGEGVSEQESSADAKSTGDSQTSPESIQTPP